MPFRVAIISTPRSGNTWLWHLLTTAYDVPGVAVHNPFELEWEKLPPECVLQVHWRLIPSFVDKLREHSFRVVVMGRHPLDVLISILHFSMHDAATARWLEGEDGNERAIFGAMPRSTTFRDYATGPRAAALLGVSSEWWNLPDILQVRYEDLNGDPAGQLQRVTDHLGMQPRNSIAEAIEATTIPKLRARWQNNHYFWKGKTSLWRSLLTERDLPPIAQALQPYLKTLGYECVPDSALDERQADTNWLKLVWSELVEDLHSLPKNQKALRASEKALVEMTARRDELSQRIAELRPKLETSLKRIVQVESELTEEHRAHDQAQRDLHVTRLELARWQRDFAVIEESRDWALGELTRVQQRFAPYAEARPWALGIAASASRTVRRFPALVGLVKRATGACRNAVAMVRAETPAAAARRFARKLRFSLTSFWLT